MTSHFKHYRVIRIDWDEESAMNEDINMRIHKDEVVVAMAADGDEMTILVASNVTEKK